MTSTQTDSSSPSAQQVPVHILLVATGSVASVKLPQLVKQLLNLKETEVQLMVVCSRASLHFFHEQDIPADVPVFVDQDEWDSFQKVGDPVLHIELRRWADLLLMAPACANTIACMANGLSNSLVTSIARAWDLHRPFLIAPAMNTLMWEHPFTQKHLRVLRDELHQIIIQPIEKQLACGDVGRGAMENVDPIVEIVRESIRLDTDRRVHGSDAVRQEQQQSDETLRNLFHQVHVPRRSSPVKQSASSSSE